MREELLYEEYAEDQKHKFEIYKYGHLFDLYLLDFDEEWDGYYDRNNVRHLMDTLEKAKHLGKQLL